MVEFISRVFNNMMADPVPLYLIAATVGATAGLLEFFFPQAEE